MKKKRKKKQGKQANEQKNINSYFVEKSGHGLFQMMI